MGGMLWIAGMPNSSLRVFLAIEANIEAASVMADAEAAVLYERPFIQESHGKRHTLS